MRILVLTLIITWLLSTCGTSSNKSHVVSNNSAQYELNTIIDKKEASNTNCGFKDGTYFASADYHNPKTKHTAKYELQVHVKDCKVVQIDFPNGGWLDEDHIPATQINESKEAVLKDDKGRQWKIRLH
jgi:major membrane immunogen (membrane-anchored lipoprotein)